MQTVETNKRKCRSKGDVRKYRGPRFVCQPLISKGQVLRDACGRTQIHQGPCRVCGNKTDLVMS